MPGSACFNNSDVKPSTPQEVEDFELQKVMFKLPGLESMLLMVWGGRSTQPSPVSVKEFLLQVEARVV